MKTRSSTYPLTVPWLIGALLAGLFAAVWSDDLIPGYAIFVLIGGVALTWRRGEAPIFAFVIAYQWVAVTIGFWYERAFGVFPSDYAPGDIPATVTLALTGLALLACGIRVATALVDRFRPLPEADGGKTYEVRNVRGLFLLVLAAYAVDYLMILNPKAYPGFDVILERVMDLRQVLLLVLWYEVLRTRQHMSYLWISLAWVFAPRLGAYFSDFKSPLIMLGIVIASTWRPWEPHWWRRGVGTLARATPVLALLLVSVLVWQAGVRQETRKAHDLDLVGQRPSERIELFLTSAKDALPTLIEDLPLVVEGLVERVSYITFFSLVLDRVPQREPHANGELLEMALVNSTVPRFLFPDKPPLPSDSYLTRRFAGALVADGMTSISIGYMAEFYADWGLRGMLISVFLFGAWIGIAACVVRRVVTPSIFVNAVLIMVFLRVAEFETQFVKSLAALNVSLVVNIVMLLMVRPWVVRLIGLREAAPASRAAAPVAIAGRVPVARSV